MEEMNQLFFENVLGHLEESVFVLDRNGTLVYANDYLLKHGIMSKEEVFAVNSYTLFQSGQSNVNIFRIVKEQKQTVTAFQTITSHTADKEKRYMVTHVPILDKDGELELSIGIIRDVDAIETLYKDVLNAKQHILCTTFKNAPVQPKGDHTPLFRSGIMKQLFQMADSVAASDATVLILGESGTGKEVLAAYLHEMSNRRNRTMLALNCAVLTDNLLESELFGYEKGAFTGALPGGKKGLLEEADGSTLFLDEVDSLPMPVQAKLLRVLETHEVRRVGGNENIKTDFRVIAATNADLKEKVAAHEFREDLYYRLNVVPLSLPPLRERAEDIIMFAEHFLDMFGKKYGRFKSLSEQAKKTLMSYSWPGNVREIRNFMERLVLTTDINVKEIQNIPEMLLRQQSCASEKDHSVQVTYGYKLKENIPLKQQVNELERELIQQAVEKYGSLSKAAKALGIDKSTLIRKRKD